MRGHLPNLPSSMREPDFMELVWENGEVVIRSLSPKITRNTSSLISSKDGVAAHDSSTVADPISGLSGVTKQCYDKQLLDSNNTVPLHESKEKKPSVDDDKDDGDNVGFMPPDGSNPFENDGNLMGKPDSEPQRETLAVADELSEAVPNRKQAQDNTGFKGNPEQMVPSSSFCSRGASNCPPTYTLKRRYEDTDDLSKDTEIEEGEEEPVGTTKGNKGGGKRKRKTEVHNLSERKRRDKINKKMRALKELIPNCNKVDKASMLDEAIEYLKNLQFQVQMMSIGNGVYMQPMMFPSPSAMQHLGGYSPMMGMRMQMGLGPQFLTSVMPGTAALPGNHEGRLNMFGFPAPDEVLLRSMSRSPFVSSVGSFTVQSVQPHGAAAVVPVELEGGGNPVSTSEGINPTQLT